jgi:catechol 2,3-dioxygenase-like lactoylglutathione lyase family enzyme
MTRTPDLTKVRFTLAVHDLAKSTDYYTSVLGLSIDFTAPGWTFLSRGTFRVMLGECTDAIPPAGASPCIRACTNR